MAITKNNNGFYNYSSGSGTSKSVTTGNNATDSYITGKNNEALARALQYGQTQPTSSVGTGAVAGAVAPIAPTKKAIDVVGAPTGNGGGSSSGSASASTGSGVDMGALSSYMSNLFNSYYQQRMGQLQDAYNNSRANIENAYNESRGLLQSNYDTSRDALNSSYNNSRQAVQDDADKSLREAYVNRMLSQKNLNQQMSAAGLSGGATESTLASMANNYGNARNNINTTLNSNISNLNATRDTNLASILQTYNSNLANIIQQRANALTSIENALASGIGAALDKQFEFQTSSPYLSLMQNLAAGSTNVGANQAYANSAMSQYADYLNNSLNNPVTSGLTQKYNVSLSNDYISKLQNALKDMGMYRGKATTVDNPVSMLSTNQTGLNNISNNTNYEEYQKLLEALR